MSETRSHPNPAAVGRLLARRCTRATLATSLNGAPYASLLLVTVDHRNIFELCDLPLDEATGAMASLELSERDHLIADRVTER